MRAATAGQGVDVVLEYSGETKTLQGALRGAAVGGNIVGSFPEPMEAGLDLGADAPMNRPNIIFARADRDPNRDRPRRHMPRIESAVHRMILDGLIDGASVVAPVPKFSGGLQSQYDPIVVRPDQDIKLGIEH